MVTLAALVNDLIGRPLPGALLSLPAAMGALVLMRGVTRRRCVVDPELMSAREVPVSWLSSLPANTGWPGCDLDYGPGPRSETLQNKS